MKRSAPARRAYEQKYMEPVCEIVKTRISAARQV